MPWRELSARQGSVARFLKNSVLNDRVAHAYLFVGPDNHSKEIAARLLAQAVNCGAGHPCGTCSSCRVIAAGTHPDVQTIASDGRFLRLDKIRDLSRRAQNTAFLGRVKVYVVPDADKLLPEAANHLLKMLEEPPEATVFVLYARYSESLLPTIVSRCQEVKFAALSLDALTGQLVETGLQEDVAHLLARLSGGDGEIARDLSGTQGMDRDEFLALAEKIPAGKGELFEVSEAAAKMPTEFLLLLQALYRDLLVWKAGTKEDLYFMGQGGLVARLAALYRLPQLLRCSETIEKTRKLVFGRTNVNVRLALEALLVDLVPDG